MALIVMNCSKNKRLYQKQINQQLTRSVARCGLKKQSFGGNTTMANSIQLTKRLQAVAAFVRPGSFFIDVGCDHAYLPIALAEQGVIQKGIASDIHKGPLEKARQNIAACGFSDAIAVKLTGGLQGISPVGQTDVAIAGMGGDTIEGIIREAPWLQNPSHQLILQPMTKGENLRRCLCDMGYQIVAEYPVEESGHIYVIMSVFYKGETMACSDLYAYWGKVAYATAPAVKDYLQNQANRILAIAKGLQKSGKCQAKAEKYFHLYNIMVKKLEEMGYGNHN